MAECVTVVQCGTRSSARKLNVKIMCMVKKLELNGYGNELMKKKTFIDKSNVNQYGIINKITV